MKKFLSLFMVLLIILFYLLFFKSEAPHIPIYKNSFNIIESDYEVDESGGSLKKQITFLSTDDPYNIVMWYDKELSKTWYSNYHGYIFPANKLYGNKPASEGFSDYTLGIITSKVDNFTKITLLIKKN